MSNRRIVRSVSATGKVTTEFDRVGISLTVKAHGDNTKIAKTNAKPMIDAVKATIEGLRQAGVEIPDGKYVVTPEFSPNSFYNRQTGEHETKGYICSYAVSFESPNVDRAAEMMDALTEIEEAAVDSPRCFVSTPDTFYQQACEDAFARAQEMFATECETLGKNADDYEFINWSFSQHRHEPMRGKMMAMAASEGAGGGGPDVEVETGDTTIEVSIQLDYARKG